MGKETISRTTLVKGVTACVVVAASLGIIQIGEYSINSSEEAASTAVSSSTGTASYTPGTYTATAAGIQSDVTVSCTFDEGSITSITVDVSGETAGLGADIGDEMIESFLAAQSSNVDGVSGATITSDALKAALEDCIAQATGGSGSSDEEDAAATEDSSESDEEDAAATEQESAAEADTDAAVDTEADETEGESEAAADNSETETESEADSEVAAAASDSTAASSGSGIYTPGTYTATAAGMESDVKVTVTVDETSILSLGIDVSGETAGIGADVGPEISEQILNAQSANVDGVSGATVTSTAVKTALADALDQASGGFSDSTEDTAATVAEAEAEAAQTEAAEVVTEAPETEAAETESEAIETDAPETETEAIETDAPETETEALETDAAETEAMNEAASNENGSSFVPGTYTASAAGISSDVTVTCTFDETGLVSIEADVSGETAGIGADIGDTMISRVLEAQSSEVDGVSGATITSDAFKAAVADCMEQAGFVAEAAEEETEAESDTDAENSADGNSDSVLAAAADAPFTPGTYTATAQGLESEITVNVTFDEYNIVAVGTWLEGETDGIGADIGEEISNQILEAQSAEVDGVSGATVTSTAVKEAVADCIAQAKAITEEETEEITEADTEVMTEAPAETETDTASEEITEADTEVMTEAPVETEAETASEETIEADTEEMTEAETESAAAADGSRFFAGVYTASAEGISSDVTVTIIVDENSILSIGYDVSGETAGIGADIGPEISGQILTAQSAEVDGISGATITSDAFKAALADCIAQAEGSENAEAESESDVEEEESEDTDTATTESVDDGAEDTSEEASLSSLYTAGVYSSSAAGISSDVVVTVSFDDNSITAIGYDLTGETADIGALIGPEISGQILTAQSADVDGVSGATITSDAFKAAVADCIAQAQAGSSDLVIIGGADGPTSIFLAGTAGEEETEQSETNTAE
ncbi:MAG: FMN-binding protein [Lachnospiraceae bacterium]|nr:FMN-binding protein [Lachnospiraceae bacterium]